MKSIKRRVLQVGCAAAVLAGAGIAQAASMTYSGAPMTYTGTFTADNDVASFTFTAAGMETLTAWTDSYGGGSNLNGTMASAGGFVPALTLFSNATGQVVAFDGADGMCSGSAMADSKTGMCDDAYVTANLMAGQYTLDLTEFPNEAAGTLSDGFVFGNDPTATGDVCGVSGGMFLQSDVAPCVQRSADYSLNISTSPEPGTMWLMASALVGAGLWRRRKHGSSK